MTCAFSFCFVGQVDKLPTSLTCQINIEPTSKNLTLIGQQDNVMTTRNEILNLYPSKIHLNLKIPNNQDCNVLRKECEKIAVETNTIISITEPIPQSSFTCQNTVNILVTGVPDNAELARVQTLVMLDRQSNLDVDTLNIPYKLHHLICGRKRTGLQSILEETAISIYFPSPFIYNDQADDNYSPTIYITGESNDAVARVKEMLTKLATQKAQSMYQKDAVLHPRKLDWMLIHRRNEIRKIMRDNGSFVSFPKPSTGGNLVTVYAESRVNAERTLRCLHFLACGIYEACFYINHLRDGGAIYGAADAFFNNVANIAALVSQLSQTSGAEVAYKTEPVGCIEVFGTERAIRHVYQRLHEMSFIKMFHQSTVFYVELSNDQREFISGKKSGKINKIMKTSGAKIKFVPFSEYNFIIEVESNNFNKALDGLTLLQEELPAEISFYVPEVYHKRIIGVGGKNIQRIMKKYGVYVKFSNAEEFAALGGYYDNVDNVVARTPMKNQVNLENLRHAVMDLINPKDRDCVEQVLYDIPFWLHRTLIRDQATYFAEMTKKTNTQIIWPDDESASDTLILVGPESQVGLAAQMVRSIVPEEYNVYLPWSTLLKSVLESKSFEKEVVQRLKNEYTITVELKSKPTIVKNGNGDNEEKKEENDEAEEEDNNDENEDDENIALKMTKGNLDCLNIGLEILIGYLKTHQVNLYDDSAIVRHKPAGTLMTDDSSIDATRIPFNLFDPTKMIPSAIIPSDLMSPTPSSSSSLMGDFSSQPPLNCYSLFDYPSSTSGNALDASWRSFRDMNTNNNIRAIFDSPHRTASAAAVNHQLPSLPLVSPLSFRGGPPPPTSPNGGLDIWSNPPQQVSLNGFVGSPPPPLPPVGLSSPQELYTNNLNGFYQPLSTTATNAYVVPTSSTSTGSNNSSMHSSQSLPDILSEERPTSSTKKSITNSTFQQQYNLHHHTPQQSLPPLIYPSASSTTTSNSTSSSSNNTNRKPLSFASAVSNAAVLSSSISAPTTSSTTSKNSSSSNRSLDFPALFSLNHSSGDETVIVQSLLNNMSINGGPSSELTH